MFPTFLRHRFILPMLSLENERIQRGRAAQEGKQLNLNAAIALIAFYLVINAQALEANSLSGEACPGAAAWVHLHPPAAESAGVPRSEPDLLKELKHRVDVDQDARKRWVANSNDESLNKAVSKIDDANLIWL